MLSSIKTTACLLVVVMISASLSGCLGNSEEEINGYNQTINESMIDTFTESINESINETINEKKKESINN